jgi:hypothetical protein
MNTSSLFPQTGHSVRIARTGGGFSPRFGRAAGTAHDALK